MKKVGGVGGVEWLRSGVLVAQQQRKSAHKGANQRPKYVTLNNKNQHIRENISATETSHEHDNKENQHTRELISATETSHEHNKENQHTRELIRATETLHEHDNKENQHTRELISATETLH